MQAASQREKADASKATREARAQKAEIDKARATAAAAEAGAKVFYTRSQALDLAFPEADRIEDETVLLDDRQAQRIERLARGPPESRLAAAWSISFRPE